MNAYRNKLRGRIIFSSVFSVMLLTVMFLANMNIITSPVIEADFFRGFINGLCIAAIAMSVLHIVGYLLILNNKEKLKANYIKENDELKKKIVSEAGTNEYYFVVTGLTAGIIIGGYLNIYVFWSFYIALLYYCLIRGFLCVLYKIKYKTDSDDTDD